MNDQQYSTSKAAIIEAAKKSAQKRVEEREKSRKIFDYYSRRKPSNKQVLK